MSVRIAQAVTFAIPGMLTRMSAFAHLADVIKGVDFINGIKPSNANQAAA